MRGKFLLMGLFVSGTFCHFPLQAQEVTDTLSGTVTDKIKGTPIAGALVSLTDNGKIIQFTHTTQEGKYTLTLKKRPTQGILRFSLMNYSTVTLPLNKTADTRHITMTEKATVLREVLIKAPDIRQQGDTIKYNVSSFADIHDKSLADVLKKMPGIEVSSKGQIRFNGKNINRFYIEGHDMLGGRYGIATNNIQQKDVSTVEVMENHQPIRALEKISFSQDPAINIRLKASAKEHISGTLKAGAGISPTVWNGETTLMRFTKKLQTLSTFKTNNVGSDMTKENEWLPLGTDNKLSSSTYHLQDYIRLSPDNITDIRDERVRFNRTFSATTNNLWALGKDADLSAQLTYSYNRQTSASFTSTAYFLNDSTILNTADEQAKTHTHRLTSDIVYSKNGPTAYMRNKLSTDLQWDNVQINTNGTYPNRQQAKLPRFLVSDLFELLKRKGVRTFSVNSYNSYQTDPQSLQVYRTDNRQFQQLTTSAFYSHTHTWLGFYLRPFTLSLKAGLKVMARSMHSDLTGIPDSLGVPVNQLHMTYVKAYGQPEIELNQGDWHVQLSAPVSFAPYYYKEKGDTQTQQHYEVRISPLLTIDYKPTPQFEIGLSGNISPEDVSEQDFYRGWIMSDYRNLSTGLTDYTTGSTKSLFLDLSYKIPLQALFFHAYVMRDWTENSRTSLRTFQGDYILNSFLPYSSREQDWMAEGKISKGIRGLKGVTSLTARYSYFKGSMVQNNTPSAYRMDTWKIRYNLSIRPWSWLSLDYNLIYNQEKLQLDKASTHSRTSSFSQQITGYLYFTKSIYLSFSGEHYRNQLSSGLYKKLFLMDSSVFYALKNGMEFSFSVQNLLNQRTYGYSLYDGLTNYNKVYVLRPRTYLLSVFMHI